MRRRGIRTRAAPTVLRIEHEHGVAEERRNLLQRAQDRLVLDRTDTGLVLGVDHGVAKVAVHTFLVDRGQRAAIGLRHMTGADCHRHVATQAVTADIGHVLVGGRHLRKEQWIAPAERHQAAGPGAVGLGLRAVAAVADAALRRRARVIGRHIADLGAWHLEVELGHRQRVSGGGRRKRHADGQQQSARTWIHVAPLG